MGPGRLLAQLICCLALVAGIKAAARSHKRAAITTIAASGGSRVVALTDLDFDEQIDNGKTWLINLYSHHCPVTTELERTFEHVADTVSPDISVGKIDGTSQSGLVSRFQMRGFHGIFHINGSETRAFCEGREGNACEGKTLSHQKLVKFAREGWKAAPPRSGCSSPASRCGKAVGKVTKLPAKAKQTYFFLHDERQYSDLTIFAGLLAVPVVVGISFICFLDAYYSRRPLDVGMQAHVHAD